ncbi:hypothetical protein HFP15_34350 [Amycolatopsis sp. K13G38]|uniref:Secreted protein n=1 Tax=Amycolatopsis acididurans TaxID=2724524 RepID=A0ABX1JHS5_9PSEU|nr:hypothetical protein [Amycolatopsis acididurans]
MCAGTTLLALLASGTGVAGATETVNADTDTSFGLLGPVGLVAVVLGVLGMALGALRHRRKAQAVEPQPAEPSAEETTRPSLTPYRQPPF